MRVRWARRSLVGFITLAGVLAAQRYLQSEREFPFETVAVREDTLVHEIYAVGTLNARVTVELRSQLSGVVKSIAVDHNRRVRRGQRLALLDTDLLEAELAHAEATLASATALLEKAAVQLQEADVSLQRTRQLFAAGQISQSQLDGTEARSRSAKAETAAQERQVAQCEATVRRARLHLEHAAFRSPIDGVVLSRAIEVGQTVNTQSPLFVVGTDLTELQLDSDVSEADIGHVAAGQPLHFSVDAYPGHVFTGVVKEVRVGPYLKQQAVYYRVAAMVRNADGRLRPGMTADVWIETARREHALLVWPTAIKAEAGRTYVEVLEGRKVGKRDIARGLTSKDGLVEVLSGLARGEHVLVPRKGR